MCIYIYIYVYIYIYIYIYINTQNCPEGPAGGGPAALGRGLPAAAAAAARRRMGRPHKRFIHICTYSIIQYNIYIL